MRPNTPIVFAGGIALGGLLSAATIFLAGAARADVPDRIINEYAGPVCGTLDDYPTFDGIYGIGYALTDQGWTSAAAGEILIGSVISACPEYLPLLESFIESHLPGGVNA